MENKTKQCPFCGEQILIIAKKCRYCREWLDDYDEDTTSNQTLEVNSVVKNTDNNTDSNKYNTSLTPVKLINNEDVVSSEQTEVVDNNEEKTDSKGYKTIKSLAKWGLIVVLCFLAYPLLIEKIPYVEGKWKISENFTDTIDDDYYGIVETNMESIDEISSDGTDTEIATFDFNFCSYDEDFDVTVILQYVTSYTGTWKQDDKKVTWNGIDYSWELKDSYVSPDNYYGKMILDYFKETFAVLFDSMEDERLGVSQDSIISFNDKTNTIYLQDDDGEQYSMTKLDGKIKTSIKFRPLRIISRYLGKYSKGKKVRLRK